ncbi:response regulator transcription factor [Niabella aquatica]
MKKILIIEDEFIIADRIKELLENNRLGSCTVKDTYKESMEWIRKELPDLILLDIRLFEDKDAGIRIAHYVQDHYSIPFIFLSGYSDDITLKQARLYRPATFITKPVIEKQLLAAIKMALPEADAPKIKTVFLKGRYFENMAYEHLVRTSFSAYDFVSKEIRLSDITIIQSFNHVRRNTLLFKFKEPDTFFVIGSTIEKIQEILPACFEQVHQSFIINTCYISAKREGRYITVGNENVPVGPAFRK